MAINKTKYDGVHYQVSVMNMVDGSVQVHGAGCADLKRGKNFAEKYQANELWDCVDREDIREAYNADFDEETDGWYDMTWMPCAKHVPEREVEAPAEAKVEVKRGPKWTYIFVDGEQVMEVRSHLADAVLATVKFN